MDSQMDEVFAEDGNERICGSTREGWANHHNLCSISSEASDDVADDLLSGDFLSTQFGDDARQRRPSRAPVEVTGRDAGVWSANEVARELRNMSEALWELAAKGDDRKMLDMVMLEGVNSVVAHTTLLMAAWHGLTELTSNLLAAGASPDACDIKGRTPLHLACCAGADDCVLLLIKANANVRAWDGAKKATPLHCAAGAASPESVQLLINAGAALDAGLSGLTNKGALHCAVQAGSPKCVQLLLDAGASPNTPHLFTETPLHLAAALGAADCMALLLASGADVRVQVGPTKATSLHLAAEDGNADCTRMLLDAGADPHSRNGRQQTPAHLAALAQSAETLELLLQRGADPNSVDSGGRTPLHSAIVKGSRCCECVRLLVEHGADVNRADAYGYTPLHIAALSEFSPCVELLIRHGGHVTARTKGGVSALSFMVRRTPDAVQRFTERLDASISLHEHELGDVDCTIKLDFRVLVPRTCYGEAELLLSFVESGQRHLLQHPLCQTFLFLKWKHIRKFFLISLLFHAIFVALHTTFVMSVYLEPPANITITTLSMIKSGRSMRPTVPTVPRLSELPMYVTILGYGLLCFNVMLVMKEIFQMAHAKFHYMRHWENWLQWLIIATVFSCVEALWLDKPRLTASWQHHIAALGIFFTWLELMMLVGRFPMFGLYIQMLTTVAANFVKFLLAYSCLLIAFALSFTLLFPQYPAFRTVPLGLLKTVVMMIGEFEYEDMFFTEGYPIIYKGTLHLLFFIFVLLAGVVLMNLLVGLAVSDIQGLQRSAGLDRLVRQAELVSHIESLLFSKLLKFIPGRILTFCHQNALLVASNYRWAFYIRPNDPREARIPKELIEGSYRLVASRSPRRTNKDPMMRTNRQVSRYSTASVMRPSRVDTSMLEQIQNQLGVLVHKSEQSISVESILSQRITNLANQIETLRQEIAAQSKRQLSISNSANGSVIPDLSSSV